MELHFPPTAKIYALDKAQQEGSMFGMPSCSTLFYATNQTLERLPLDFLWPGQKPVPPHEVTWRQRS
jgi:hypothetical protein